MTVTGIADRVLAAGQDHAACPPEPVACRDARRRRNDPRTAYDRHGDSRN